MDQQREEIALIQVVPLSYDVTIDVTCLENNNASEEILLGQSLYKFEVKISTNTILLNGKELIIGKVKLLNEERKEVLKEGSNQIKIELNNESNVTSFIFDSEINIGIYILEIEYSCKFRQDLMGCYGCNFNNKDGQSKRMCVTQFEAAWARAAFPCVDQPNAKAVFTVHIIHPPSLTALSNMPISSVDIGIGEDNKWTKTNFISSPQMSTYLVAWVVGEFEFVSGSCYDGKLPVRVYTLPGQSQFANFARDIAVETIEFLSNFTQIPIPLPKMDLIAIPDFQAGAMENWGLITFNETSLLADENISTTYQLQYIGSTISHELVHQWAGNLVTPFWWDDLWLNEGFATFLGNYVIDKLHPSWNRSLIYQDRNNAFSIDEIEEATHPIEVKVLRAVDADDVFDAISYNKSAIVLQMIFDFIGEDRFKQGFTNYLMKHEYSNASSTDLWEALAESSENKELPDLMKSWTQQAGFPLVCVKEIKQQENEKELEAQQQLKDKQHERVFEFTQYRFSKKYILNINEQQKENSQEIKINKEEKEQLWMIPILMYVMWDGQEKPQLIKFNLNEKRTILKLTPPLIPKDKEEEDQESNNPQLQWIKLNTNQGFYRVHYQDDWILNALLDELIHNQFNSPVEEQTTISRLPQSDRMGIQNDLASLSIKGLIPFASYLLFVKRGYWQEQCPEIRQDIMRNIQNPMNMFIEAIFAEEEKQILNQKQKISENEFEVQNENKFEVKNLLKKYQIWFRELFTKFNLNIQPNLEDQNKESSIIQTQNTNQQERSYSEDEKIKDQNIQKFDALFFPIISPCHRKLMVQHIQNYKLRNKQVQQQDLNVNEDQISVEQTKINYEERLQADDRLAQAVMSISSNFRSQYFSNVCKIEEEINQDSQKEYNKPTISSELTSIYPSNWNIIEAERRTVLFAIYHCTSQIILPEDRLTGLRCVLQFPSPAMFQSSLILLEEEDADVGIKKQDMQTASFILSGLSAKFWKWIIKDSGIDEKTGKKQYSTFQLLRQRLGIQIIPSFIEYAVQNIVITKDDTDLEKQTAEFFETEAKNIPPYTLRMCIAKIRENSDLWESQKESVKDWLQNLSCK